MDLCLSQLPINEVKQSEADPRDVGYEESDQSQNNGEGPPRLKNLPERQACDGGDGKEHCGNGRCLLTDTEVNGHDDAEMDRIHPNLPDERHHDGNNQYDRCGGVEKHSRDEKEDIQKEQDQVLV